MNATQTAFPSTDDLSRQLREDVEREYASPPDERSAPRGMDQGGAGRKGLVLGVAGNDSRFREGDIVALSLGDPSMALCDAVVLEAEDEQIEIQLWDRTADSLNLPPGFRGLQLDETSIDLERFYLGAIEDLAKTSIGREKILPLLDGTLKPKLDLEEFDAVEGQAEGDPRGHQKAEPGHSRGGVRNW